jgi:multicomponent Na+:H+ antiporter subunit E
MVVSEAFFRLGNRSPTDGQAHRIPPNRPSEADAANRRNREIPRILSLTAALFLFWLALSGHYTPFLIGSGLVAAVAVTALGLRAGYADGEGHPVEYLLPGLLYWPWLVVEIAKSALDVARIIVDPRLPISPRLIRAKASQRTAVGIATYANSITLTPGTITVEVNRRDSEFLVHALTAEGAAGVIDGAMDRRVTAFEGKR